MTAYTVYDRETGRLLFSGEVPESMMHLQDPHHVLGVFDPATHFFDRRTGTVQAMPPKPEGYYAWDYTARAWVPDPVHADLEARQRRYALLLESDWTQLPDVPLATKDAWAAYRQALRDLTDQPGYPLTIEWPARPSN